MRKKTIARIRNEIALSIRYDRLKTELNDARARVDSAQKKGVVALLPKKGSKEDTFIAELEKQIGKIEQSYEQKSYTLNLSEQMDKHLNLLQSVKNADLIKFGIAFEIIMDDAVDYTDSTTGKFIEDVSFLLFKDSTLMKKMMQDYEKIAHSIYGKNLRDSFDAKVKAVAKIIKKIPLTDLVNLAMFVPGKVRVVGGGIKFVAGLIPSYSKRKRRQRLLMLTSGDLAQRLIITALDLLYASRHFITKEEYNNYFAYKLAEINAERAIIMKQMFEERFEMKDNKNKIELLHNFDDYLIAQMMKQ